MIPETGTKTHSVKHEADMLDSGIKHDAEFDSGISMPYVTKLIEFDNLSTVNGCGMRRCSLKSLKNLSVWGQMSYD